jgi:hypothetical protein
LQTIGGGFVLAYRWVVALVWAALMIAPFFGAAWVLLVCSMVSPMRRHIPAWQRHFAMVVLVAVWAYMVYIAWAVTNGWEFNLQAGTVVVAWQVAQTLAIAAVGLWLWRLMGPHYAFDPERRCRPSDVRRMIALYFEATSPEGQVTLKIVSGAVLLEWPEGRKKLRPPRGVADAALLAAAFNLYPPSHSAVVITPKGGTPHALYKDVADIA